MVAAVCSLCPSDGRPYPPIAVVGFDHVCEHHLVEARDQEAAALRVEEAVRTSPVRLCDGCLAKARWDLTVPLRPAVHPIGVWRCCVSCFEEQIELGA